LVDKTLVMLPIKSVQDNLFGVYFPGTGIILALLILFLTGLFVTHFIGQRIIVWSERVVFKIPFISGVYQATKQIIEALLSNNQDSFKRVVLVEFPKAGSYALAFETGRPTLVKTDDVFVSVFVPTTPNPTSGFLLLVKQDTLSVVDMSIEQALKYIVSLGVVK
jgi:uncharacterized membrane protein